MEAVFIKILNMSWTAGWMILAVMLFRLIFKRAPKAVVCILWGLVALRLLIPFSIESSFSLIPSAEPISENVMFEQTPAIESGITIVDDTVNTVLKDQYAPEIGESANPMQIVMFLCSLVWLTGAACILVYGLISYLLLKKKVSASVKLEKNIKMCDGISTPFILGFVHPIIYLPSDISKDWIEHVILHENAHLKRKDHWWKPLGFLLLAIYWFHPLMWIAYLLLCRDIEYACDERVITKMDADGVKQYSASLLQCSISRRSLMMCPLAFGEVGVKQRIKSILSFKKPTMWIVITAILVSVILGATLLTDPKRQGESYDILLVEGESDKVAAFTHADEHTVYFYGVCEVKIRLDEAYIDLSDALQRDAQLIEKLLEKASNECEVIRDDSGSVLYHNDNYSLLNLNVKVSTLGTNQNNNLTYDGGIYFGTPDMTIDDIERLWANRLVPGNGNKALTINLGKVGSKLQTIQYGGKSVSGLDATDTVKQYYELLEKQGVFKAERPDNSLFAEELNAKNQNAVVQDITLLEFTQCGIVNSSLLRQSDYEYLREIAKDNYACCYVQTADKILCNKDGAFGNAGEEVARQYFYFLVRKSQDSEWKIYDYGYPPFLNN